MNVTPGGECCRVPKTSAWPCLSGRDTELGEADRGVSRSAGHAHGAGRQPPPAGSDAWQQAGRGAAVGRWGQGGVARWPECVIVAAVSPD